jgi:hypothetical protein
MIAVMAYCVMAMPMIAALAFWTRQLWFAVVRDLFCQHHSKRHSVGPQSMFSIIALVQSGRKCLHTSRPVERSVWHAPSRHWHVPLPVPVTVYVSTYRKVDIFLFPWGLMISFHTSILRSWFRLEQEEPTKSAGIM